MKIRSRKLWAALLVSLWVGEAQSVPRGELDFSFGLQGRMTLEIDGGRFGGAIAQQPADGKLLFAGTHDTGQGGQGFAVLRLNPDGTRDAEFATDGVAFVDFAGRNGSIAA